MTPNERRIMAKINAIAARRQQLWQEMERSLSSDRIAFQRESLDLESREAQLYAELRRERLARESARWKKPARVTALDRLVHGRLRAPARKQGAA